MITSTRSLYPRKVVVKDLGIVYGMDDKLRPVRTVAAMDAYMKQALQDLEKSAGKLGVNGVLGITFAMNEKALPLVMGTAVVLEDE